MHRVTMICTSTELLRHLEWARDNGLSPKWMGLRLDEAIQTVAIEVEDAHEIELGMPHAFEVHDPEDIILYMMKGFAVEKDTVLHRIPSRGLLIYERCLEIKRGEVGKRAPRFGHSWLCWLDGDLVAMGKVKDADEFKQLYFGSAGLIKREIALLQRLVDHGYFTEGVDSYAVIDRWGDAEAGIEALGQLLDAD